MRRINVLVVKIFLCLTTLGQTLTVKEKHDIATELFAEILFDSKSKLLQDQRKGFENTNGVKLEFRVENQSLDQLGGLSEYLFKLFQTFSSPVNTNVKTITAEFSALKNGALTNTLSYDTKATQDLRDCRFPETDSDKIDSLYNLGLSKSFEGVVENVNGVPASLDGIYPQAIWDYEKVLAAHYDCPGIFDHDAYHRHVVNTRVTRSIGYLGNAELIGKRIDDSFLKLQQNGLAGAPITQANSAVNLNVAPLQIDASFIINLNNSVNECTEDDMEVRCQMLYKKTGINFLYVTATIPFYLPIDSLNNFRDAILQTLETNNPDRNFIVGLYLKMEDLDEHTSHPVLLVKQNGSWLTQADIDFARFNNLDNYTNGTYHRFKNLFRNIPKPLTLCYQVAKVNGMLTTSYITKGQHVKGSEQMYYHSFKLDRAFDEINELRQQYNAVAATSGDEGPNRAYNLQLKSSLSNRIKVAFINASRNPKFKDAEVCFKEVYLQNKQHAEAWALKYIDDHYPDFFNNPEAQQIISEYILPSDLNTGSCKTQDNSDVIADVMGISSLLLSPTGLDLIPDALSVVYFSAIGNESEQALALVSLIAPANLNILKKGANSTADALNGIKKGEQLTIETGQLKLVTQETNQIATVFKIKAGDVDEILTQKIVSKHNEALSLLTTDLFKAKIYSHVSEKLPESKRKEFVIKFLDDAEFRNKVLDDPDEVLRWAGVWDELAAAFKPGYSKERIMAIQKGERPNPETYLKEEYLSNHVSKFNNEGASFLVVKSWIENGTNTKFPLRKFVMLKTDMDAALAKYRVTKNVNDIEDALGYARGDLAGMEDQLFVFQVNKESYNFEIPNGNEIGANSLWEPGGRTSGGYREVVVVDVINPEAQIEHNKNIENLKSQFSWEKL